MLSWPVVLPWRAGPGVARAGETQHRGTWTAGFYPWRVQPQRNDLDGCLGLGYRLGPRHCNRVHRSCPRRHRRVPRDVARLRLPRPRNPRRYRGSRLPVEVVRIKTVRLRRGFACCAVPAPSGLACDLREGRLWWTPLSRPFFGRNKLMCGGVLGLSVWGGFATPPRAIPALESALGSHPCGALSSVPVSPV